MSVIIDGTSGITSPNLDLTSGQLSVADGGTGTATGENLWRNRIINGAMNVWQRGTTGTAGSYTYVADRFGFFTGNPNITVSQSTDVPTGQGFKYSTKIQRTAASTNNAIVYFYQIIESLNMIDLAGQNFTFSFWAKAGANFSPTSGNFNSQVNAGTVADQGAVSLMAGSWTGVTGYAALTSPLTTTWTKYTVTATLGSTMQEMAAFFNFQPSSSAAGADDSMYITGVQLEKGSTATSFEYRPYGTELALCQRYYYRTPSLQIGMPLSASAWTRSTTQAYGITTFPVPLRIAPTALEQSGTASDYSLYTGTTGAVTTCSIVPSFVGSSFSNNLLSITDFAVASGLTAGQPAYLRANSTNGYLAWSAEL